MYPKALLLAACGLFAATLTGARAFRAVGGLLSAHIAATRNPDLISPTYSLNSTFLMQAEALAQRLLPAFDTPTGIPISWVNLRSGKVPGHEHDTCAACTTTLALEFRMLSVLTGNPVYGEKVDAAVRAIYARRDHRTGLVGESIDTRTGAWNRRTSGIGPGLDSHYEYLLKMYLVFGDEEYLEMFVDQYVRVQRGAWMPGPARGLQWLLDIGLSDQVMRSQFVTSLTAFWPGMQVGCPPYYSL